MVIMQLSTSSCTFRYCFKAMVLLSFGLMLMLPAACTSNSDHQRFIFKHCPNQTSIDPNWSRFMVSTLLQELHVHSMKSRFFETSVGDEMAALSGLFQCRGDISNDECLNCVNKFSELAVSSSACGDVVPARIQLSGCYISYKREEVEASRLELLHKTCGEVRPELVGFEELRDAAFAALERGIISDGNGFCDMTYQKLHLTAQCVGNLGECDCGECVSSALQSAQEKCGLADSGEIYLDSCFISYNYYPDGINGDVYNQEKHRGGTSNKLVAIVIGGIVALLLAVAACQCLRSCGKKKDDDL